MKGRRSRDKGLSKSRYGLLGDAIDCGGGVVQPTGRIEGLKTQHPEILLKR